MTSGCRTCRSISSCVRWPRSAAATRSAWSCRGTRPTEPKGFARSRPRTASPSRRIPKSAKFGGMPRSAVNAGVVDYCLAIPELAGELVRLSRHPYRGSSSCAASSGRSGDHGADLRRHPGSLRRRLQRIQAGNFRAPAGSPHGGAWGRRSAGLSGLAGAGSRGDPIPLRGHSDSRHVLLPGSGGLRPVADRRIPRRS